MCKKELGDEDFESKMAGTSIADSELLYHH
jgi:hypothetical protein